MTKLKEDLRIGLLGAAAAVLTSGVVLLIARVDAYYEYLSWIEIPDHEPCYRTVEGLWWMPAFAWHLILSVVASLLVHRYLSKCVRSPFLLWQVVGIASLLGWALSAGLVIGLECLMFRDLDRLQYILSSEKFWLTAKYVSTAFACNVFFGSVMNASSRQYREQFESEVVAD